MILQCGHCGAPLDVEAGRTVFTCRYCKTKNERDRVRTIAETTPKDFEPPKVWRPPAEFPADSSTELKYQSGRGGWCLPVGILTVIAVPIGIAVAGSLGAFDTGEATIANVELGRTVKQLDDDVDGKPSDDAVWVAMRSSRFSNVNFAWDHGHPDHVQSVSFAGKKPDESLRTALSKEVPGGFDANGSWRWEDASLSYSKDGGIFLAVDADDNPIWKEQLDVLWKIVQKAVFAKGDGATLDEKRRYLGAGYPFADLAKLSPATTVDKAVVETQKIFPGAVKTGDIQMRIGIDHPLFSKVDLDWSNQRGATLNGIRFTGLGEAGFLAHRDAFLKCLSTTYFAPRVSDTDFVKHKQSFDFRIANSVSLTIGDDYAALYAYGKLDAESWKKLVDAMAGCKG